ncbi:MAG: amidohydrolase [Clostridia bacterium]|nr:amidohydrolase [Clostridia bacterium]
MEQYKIIDFHVHPRYDFHLTNHGVDITNDRFRDDLQANGITAACGSVIFASMQGQPLSMYESVIKDANRAAFSCREQWGDFYYPGIHIHPAFVKTSCEEISRAHAQGILLIGELVPYMMGWQSYSCPEMLEILSYAAELDMVVSMHPTNPQDMGALAAALPHLKLVYAHLSGYGQYEHHLDLMQKYENVYFDYSAHGSDFDGLLRKTIDRVGRDRILFGTDYPGVNPASDIAAVLYEDLTTDEAECVFYKNAAQLMNLHL